MSLLGRLFGERSDTLVIPRRSGSNKQQTEPTQQTLQLLFKELRKFEAEYNTFATKHYPDRKRRPVDWDSELINTSKLLDQKYFLGDVNFSFTHYLDTPYYLKLYYQLNRDLTVYNLEPRVNLRSTYSDEMRYSDEMSLVARRIASNIDINLISEEGSFRFPQYSTKVDQLATRLHELTVASDRIFMIINSEAERLYSLSLAREEK